MLLPQVLHRKSLFIRLYQIDLTLSKQSQAKGCPIAGGVWIAPIIIENLEAPPVILMALAHEQADLKPVPSYKTVLRCMRDNGWLRTHEPAMPTNGQQRAAGGTGNWLPVLRSNRRASLQWCYPHTNRCTQQVPTS